MEVRGLDGGGRLGRLEEDDCIGESGSVGSMPSFLSRSSPSDNVKNLNGLPLN